MSKNKEETATPAATTQAVQSETSILDQILDVGGVRSEPQKKEFEIALKDFLAKVVEATDLVETDSLDFLDRSICEIDQIVSTQLNEVLHHPNLQKLEGSWRGLQYLVNQSITGPDLRIHVMNITREELSSSFESAGSLERSQMYHKVVESEFGMAGGKPYGVLIGDYEFSYGPEDMYLLREMSKLAASAHAPFVAAASPRLFDLDSYAELKGPDTYADVFEFGKQYIEWRAFRDLPDSRYVALSMPRVLARLPYGKDTKKVAAFDYEEAVDGRDHNKYLWMSSAWAYAARLTDAFSKDGWLARTRGYEGGGKVEELPTHVFKTDKGDLAQKCPTEIQIPDWREHELSNLTGLLPLVHWKDTSYAVFMGAQTTQKPQEFIGPDGTQATENAKLMAKLNYILCVSRFSHYLKVLARRWIGSQVTREKLEENLNDWIRQYIVADPSQLQERERGQYPLKDARIEVVPVRGRPGWYEMTAFLLPHLHLEGLTASMRLVSQMPARAQ